MKAAVVVPGGSLEIWDIPVPKIDDYEVLCEIHYGATCAGTDTRLMAGKHPRPIKFPSILGHESVGRAVKIGSKVKNIKVGDLISRVSAPAGLQEGLGICWGGFAQYGIARDHWQMKRDGLPMEKWDGNRVNQIIPEQIDERQAPMIITWRETLSYINRMGVRAGGKVLIIGSGANALAFAVHCVNRGCEVVQVGNADRSKSSLAHHVKAYIDYRCQDVVKQTGDACIGGYDYIIDGIGNAQSVNDSLIFLKHDGTLGVYGWNGRASYGLNPFLAKGNFRIYADNYDEEESHGEVISDILKGRLDASNWYDLENPVPLKDISAAYDQLRAHAVFKYLVDLR